MVDLAQTHTVQISIKGKVMAEDGSPVVNSVVPLHVEIMSDIAIGRSPNTPASEKKRLRLEMPIVSQIAPKAPSLNLVASRMYATMVPTCFQSPRLSNVTSK